MAKAKKAAPPKRASKYDPKVAIDGSFADVIKISTNYTPPKKEAPKKGKKK